MNENSGNSGTMTPKNIEIFLSDPCWKKLAAMSLTDGKSRSTIVENALRLYFLYQQIDETEVDDG